MRPYSYLMSPPADGAGHYVEIAEAKFREILRYLLAQVDVDEAWYRARYSDVDGAIRQGKIPTAHYHYIVSGYFENRMPRPFAVDEIWYLSEYPDVAEAIRAGSFASALAHFEQNGFAEGRMPYRNWSLLRQNAAMPVPA